MIVASFLFFVMLVPQIVVSVPGLPEIVRSTDLIGLALTGLYVVIRLFYQPRIGSSEALLLAFVLYTTAITVAAGVFFSLNPKYSNLMGVDWALYPLRNIIIFSPALVAFALPLHERQFMRAGLVFATLAVIANVFMILAHLGGSQNYFAHQSLFSLQTGVLRRYGGISGEAAAATFAAISSFNFMLIFLFWNRLRLLGYVATVLMLPFAMLVLISSQARVSLVVLATFFIFLFFSKAFLNNLQRLVALIVLYAGVTAAINFAEINLDQLIVLRFQNIISGNFDANELTSGRWNNWLDAGVYILHNPLFGHGYRSSLILDVIAAENFFVQMLLDTGLIGLMAFSLYLSRTVISISNAAISETSNIGRRQAFILINAMMFSVMAQWMFNDVNYYFQTFPAILAVLVYSQRLATATATTSETILSPQPSCNLG